jgi:ATP-binding cassette, subfamily F, member 2
MVGPHAHHPSLPARSPRTPLLGAQVVVSHSQDFLNGVCNNIMVMQDRKLRTWSGNYDMYVQTRAEQDAAQEKEFKKQQEYIKETKDFIASCGTYANLVRQAKSRQKILDKMYEAGLVTMPFKDPVFKFKFPETGKLPPPLISFNDVAFSYSGKKVSARGVWGCGDEQTVW